jgi:hypothetical protein
VDVCLLTPVGKGKKRSGENVGITDEEGEGKRKRKKKGDKKGEANEANEVQKEHRKR